MKWSLFWKIFGAALALMFITGCILGIIKQSSAIVYQTVRLTMAAGLGVCGIIGMLVIPVEMYFEDRAERRNRAAN
jgi:hypothetical protein